MKRILLAAAITVLVFSNGSPVFAGGSSAGKTPSGSSVNAEFFQQKIEGSITVSAYDTMLYRGFLEEAARAFEELYPGVKVNIDTFSAMPEMRTGGQGNMQVTAVQSQNDPQGRQDYLSRINTNLMSGSGADLYAMDIIPLHKFYESGSLENLDQYMEKDPGFNKSDYRQNILDAVRYHNGTWFLPLDYTFSYYTYDSTLIPADIAKNFGPDKAYNAADLLKIGIPLYNGTYQLFNLTDFLRGPGGMFNALLNESIRSYVNLENKKPNFVDGSFAEMLNSIKNNADSGYIPSGVTSQRDAGSIMQQGLANQTDRYYFKLNGIVNLMSQFTRGAGMLIKMAMMGTALGIDDDDLIAGIEANTDGSVPFKFNQGFGINSQSKNKAAAWAFLKFLLSKEMQLSTNFTAQGLAINNEARAEKAELTLATAVRSIGGVLNDQQREALKDYNAAAEALSDKINTYVIQDSSINDMITQEVQYFFNGTRTADEVARVLQNKADLYLSE